MNDVMKKLKTELLEKVKVQKAAVCSKKDALIAQRLSAKKQIVEQESIKLDNAFAKYKSEKMAILNVEFNKKAEEIAKKKSALLAEAQSSAKAEVEGEIAMECAEYDAEIVKLEKELN